MASEDSQLLNAAINCASLRRRFPPRFIGALNMRISSNPATVRCRPERTSEVICLKIARSADFGVRSGKTSKNGKTPASRPVGVVTSS
jgi:hypothetical protein